MRRTMPREQHRIEPDVRVAVARAAAMPSSASSFVAVRAAERLLDRGLEAVREVEHEVGLLEARDVLRRQLEVVRLGARRREVRDRRRGRRRSARPRRRADRSRRRRASRPSSAERAAARGERREHEAGRNAQNDSHLRAQDDNDSHHALSRTVIIEGVTSWTDEAHSRLQGSGQRMGAARAAVIEYLDEQQCCRGAQEIHEALAARGSTVGLASVYRARRRPGRAGPAPARRLRRRHRPLRAGARRPRAPPPPRLRELRQGRDVPRRPARARDRGDRAADRATTSSRTTSSCAAPAPTAAHRRLSARAQ